MRACALDNLVIGEPDECWPWRKNLKETGYGVAHIAEGRTMPAHRFVYMVVRGDIPDSTYEIDHTCNNRACCNPAHLEAVPKRVNILRGNGAAAIHARKTECPKCGGEYATTVDENGRTRRRCKPCQRAYHRAWRLAHA